MNVKDEKRKLRASFLSKRDNLSIEEKRIWDISINQKLIQLISNSDFRNIHLYLPMKSEINIYPFIDHLLDRKLNVICPKTLPKGKLVNYELKSTRELTKGVFGTSYPANSEVYNGSFDLIIIPGLAFSLSNERLGYGGGYYDRFLINNTHSLKVAICYDFQLLESLPTEDHDIKIDRIISPSREIFS